MLPTTLSRLSLGVLLKDTGSDVVYHYRSCILKTLSYRSCVGRERKEGPRKMLCKYPRKNYWPQRNLSRGSKKNTQTQPHSNPNQYFFLSMGSELAS